MDELKTVSGDSLECFLTRWYGPASLPRRALGATMVAVPDGLRSWFEPTSGWSDELAQMTVPLEPREYRMEDDKLVFWTDAEGSWVWSASVEGDLPVFEREAGTDSCDWAPPVRRCPGSCCTPP